MKATRKHGVAVLLLLASAAAQNHGAPAVLQTVTAVPDGTDVRVEFNLSAAVTPLTQTAVNPDRILLDFPNTTFDAKMPTVNVNANGVGQIRALQVDAAPLITRVVVDVDSLHTYSVDVQDERVIVKISPASARKGSHGAPAAAKPGSLTKLLHKKPQTSNTAAEDNQTATPLPLPPPPAPNPGYQLPSENASA